MILPGATLGMLGGGQLGRMFTVAARTMGYRVMVLDPDPDSPAGHIADEHLCADFHDRAALETMRTACTAITTEFENVPADTLDTLAQTCFVRPSASAVAVTQDRINEKTFLTRHGIPTNRYVSITREDQISAAFEAVGPRAVLKRSRLGYDGKGQWKVTRPDEAAAAFRTTGGAACVLEQWLEYQAELSVVLARGLDGEVRCYPPSENVHRNGILDISIVPARVPDAAAHEAIAIASKLAVHMDYTGVMAVEFFLMPDGQLLVNEIAPRPHNSGHYTLDACVTSQFDQQVRTLCGLPPGDTTLLSPVVMFNLLGDLWGASAPAWDALLRHAGVKLHLYGKTQARPGRKMGHFTCLGPSVEEALTLGRDLREALASS